MTTQSTKVAQPTQGIGLSKLQVPIQKELPLQSTVPRGSQHLSGAEALHVLLGPGSHITSIRIPQILRPLKAAWSKTGPSLVPVLNWAFLIIALLGAAEPIRILAPTLRTQIATKRFSPCISPSTNDPHILVKASLALATRPILTGDAVRPSKRSPSTKPTGDSLSPSRARVSFPQSKFCQPPCFTRTDSAL